MFCNETNTGSNFARHENEQTSDMVLNHVKRFERNNYTGKNESSKASTLTEIAGKYAEAGLFTQVLEIAKTIKDESWKASALAEIAGKYAEAGQKEKAAQHIYLSKIKLESNHALAAERKKPRPLKSYEPRS